MAVNYATACQVASFLKITVDCCTTPSTSDVEAEINRAEDRLDRRIGHAWRQKTITNEFHSLPLIYDFGWGTLVSLHHRAVQPISSCSGDKIEIWNGSKGSFTCIASSCGQWNEVPERGELYFRGYLFSIMRKNRVRVTYRYGGEPGDCWANISVPKDIEDATIKLTAINLLSSSFRYDILPRTDLGFDLSDAVQLWNHQIDKIVRDREEMFVVTT